LHTPSTYTTYLQVTQSTTPLPPPTDQGDDDAPPPPPLPEDAEVMRERVAKFGMWVQQALPVLLEIVRRGGRYTESSVSGLRPSFQEAIDAARVHWHTFILPPHFDEFVESRQSQLAKVDWIGDNSSDHCMLCVDKFSYSNRRHHCRACGILCCAPCSSKRMPLKPLKKKSIKASPGKPPPPADRVCDGCCNRLTYQAIQRNVLVAKAKKEEVLQQKKDQEALEKKGDSAHNKSKLFGAFGGSSGTSEGTDKEERAFAHSSSNNSLDTSGSGSVKKSGSNSNIVAGLQNTMGELGANLEERGEKLSSLAQKSEALDNVRHSCTIYLLKRVALHSCYYYF
jgi:hypothetical protein